MCVLIGLANRPRPAPASVDDHIDARCPMTIARERREVVFVGIAGIRGSRCQPPVDRSSYVADCGIAALAQRALVSRLGSHLINTEVKGESHVQGHYLRH
jgi:hypothetical protein